MNIGNSYPCCKTGKPKLLIVFRVANEEKKYLVCDDCSKLDYFNQHMISKIFLTKEIV